MRKATALFIVLLVFSILAGPGDALATVADMTAHIRQSPYDLAPGHYGSFVPLSTSFSMPNYIQMNEFVPGEGDGGSMEYGIFPVCYSEGEGGGCGDPGCASYEEPWMKCYPNFCCSYILEGNSASLCYGCKSSPICDGGGVDESGETPFEKLCYTICSASQSTPPCEGSSYGCSSWVPGGWYNEAVVYCPYSIESWRLAYIGKPPQEHDDPSDSDEPVDVVYGNMFTFPQVDFTLPGINEPLKFYRTYHNQMEYDGPFGYGWVHSYDVTLTKRSAVLYEVRDGDGKYHYFKDTSPSPSGYYEPVNEDGSDLESEYQVEHRWINPNGTVYHFPWMIYAPLNTPYRVNSIEYKDGNAITFSPSDGSLPTQITDTHGRTITIAYSGGRISDIYEPGRPGNKPIHYTYNASGNLTQVDYPLDADTTCSRQYFYQDPNDSHNMTRLMDERGSSFYYTYDTEDRCILSEGENFGSGPYFKTTFSYDDPGDNQTTLERVRGTETFTDIYTYTDMGYVVRVEHVDSGITVDYTYDIALGGVSKVEKLIKKPSENYYFKKITHMDERFNIIDMVEGLVDSEQDQPTSDPIEVSYEDTDNPNFPTSITDQRSSSMNFVYNAIGKIDQIYRNNENAPFTLYEITEIDYNQDGTVDTITDPNNRVTSFSYDQYGILSNVDPPGDLPAVSYDYDGGGRLTKITQKDDAGNNRYTDIDRDWLGRITQITYPEETGARLTMSVIHDAADLYDVAASYGVNMIDTGGIKTQYLYNEAGLLWKVVKDNGTTNAITEFNYDAYRNLIEFVDPEGHSTYFEYDSMDRLTAVEDHEGNRKSFSYYPDGSLKARTDQNNQTTEYEYDENNRLETITYPDYSTVTYIYEDNGLVASVTDASGTVSFSYDDINRLIATNGALSGTVDQVTYDYYDGAQRSEMVSMLGQTDYTLNAWNALSQITSPNNRLTEYSYNQYTGNLYRVTHDNNVYAQYDFDNLDRFESLANEGTGGAISSFDYGYDDSNRIETITVTANHSAEPYGGLKELTINTLNQVTSLYVDNQQAATFSYDFNGNLEEKTEYLATTEYEYDYENRLVRITYPDEGWTEFVYDPLGRRLKTIEKNAQGQTTDEIHYVYDGLDLIAELDYSDVMVAGYTHGPGIDDPLIMRYDGGDYFLLKNHLGSITEITDVYQNTVKTYDYDAFGAILAESGSLSHNAFTYTAREYHSRSGLYYYRARWYDPQLGRFITQDPIGHLGGANLYAYVGNMPINWIDPLGLKTFIYLSASVGGSLGIVSVEYGTYYLIDPLTGEYYQFEYTSGGVGLGIGIKTQFGPEFSGAGQFELGVMENAPCDPRDMSNNSLTVSAFAALGLKGVSGQVTGTSFWGEGELGSTAGVAGGVGVGVSGMYTRSKFLGKGNVLPADIQQKYEEALRRLQ